MYVHRPYCGCFWGLLSDSELKQKGRKEKAPLTGEDRLFPALSFFSAVARVKNLVDYKPGAQSGVCFRHSDTFSVFFGNFLLLKLFVF